MVDTPLQFQNFGNALLAGTHARYYGQEADLKRDEERRRQAVQPDIPAAMAGDNAAMGRVAAGDPKTALVITQALSRLDANKLAQTKAAAEYTGRAANAVLQADPSERASVYQQMHALGVRSGYDMSGLPQQYTPALDGILRGHRAQAVPILEWFKSQEGMPTPMGGGPAAPQAAGPQGGPRAAIAGIESAGQPNGGYGAVGPVANDKGNRAYGKYQVMDFNIGPWTAEILGRPMTPQEFLANPEAQDKVFDAKFAQYKRQFGGDEAAARAWFAGPAGMNNPLAADVNGTTVAQYGSRFNQGMGGQAAPGVPGPVAMPPPPAGLTPSTPPAAMPGAPTQLVPPGPPPAQMPQGSGGDGSGTPVPPAQGLTRGIQLPPGARMMGIKGVPVVKDGNVLIVHPDGTQDWLPLPPRTPAKEPGNTAPAGPFAGNAIEAQYANILAAGAVDPAVRGTFAYAQAYAHAAAPHTTINANGVAETIQPDVSHIAKPTFAVGGAPPSAAPAGPQPATPTAQGATAPDGPQPPLPLPGGQSVTVTPIPGAQAGKPMSSEQARDAGFADRMLNSNKLLDTFATQGANPGGRLNERIPFGVGNYRQTPEYQQFKQARDDFINAQLRRESGAAISEAEYARADSQYFPQPGDKPEVIKQKEVNRRLAVEAMVRGAGPTYKPNAAESARDQFDIGKIPQPARDRLKANPGERAQFDEIFGAGAADKVLGR